MEPATTIATAATISSLLLRGLSDLFGKKPIDPYKYYQLGSYSERWWWGRAIGLSAEDCDATWTHGMEILPGDEKSNPDWKKFLRSISKISYLAPSILQGKPIARLKNLHHPKTEKRDGKWWDWIDLGRAEYRERWLPKANALLGGMDINAWVQVQTAVQNDLNLWTLAYKENPKSADVIKKLAQARINYAQVMGRADKQRTALQTAWKQTAVAPYLQNAQQAQAELNRWQIQQAESLEAARADPLWYGPPVPWALEMAAQSYGQNGPAALLLYLSINERVTADLLRIVQSVCPAALADPILKAYLAGR